jgi:AcrR family transcriptional regulator
MLEAARTVFQRSGLAAQMDAVAAEAGLGVGTLYRHFPTREALIDVLVEERLERLLASTENAADNVDPWAAVEDLVWRFAAFEAEDRGMADILSDYRSRAMDAPDAPVAAFMDHLTAAVARAQSAGAMRTDISAIDVLTAVCGLGKMVGPATASDPQQWRRLVGVLLDGLRLPH